MTKKLQRATLFPTLIPPKNTVILKKKEIKKIVKEDFELSDDDFKHEASTKYNCHGFTFKGKLQWINDPSVIIKDEGWMELPGGKNAKAQEGDIVVYKKGDRITHTGKVVQFDKDTGKVTKVQSKWGGLPEIIHDPDNALDGRKYDAKSYSYADYGEWKVFRMKITDKKEINLAPFMDGEKNSVILDRQIDDPFIIPAGDCSIEFPSISVSGTTLPIDSTALFLAGLSQSMVWMIPTILGLAVAGVIIRHKLK